jgi:hypothetical protein
MKAAYALCLLTLVPLCVGCEQVAMARDYIEDFTGGGGNRGQDGDFDLLRDKQFNHERRNQFRRSSHTGFDRRDRDEEKWFQQQDRMWDEASRRRSR